MLEEDQGFVQTHEWDDKPKSAHVHSRLPLFGLKSGLDGHALGPVIGFEDWARHLQHVDSEFLGIPRTCNWYACIS
jgi:hypothetical protein